jgi:hypothetical protein
MTAEKGEARTAVVIVHGLGERSPMQTLDDFTKTALRPSTAEGVNKWDYYPLPTDITSTYEARRFATDPEQGHVEIYEYHWSFLMTANKFAGVAAAALRLFLRRPGNVPDALLGIWRRAWTVLLAILLAIPVLFVSGYALNSDVPVWIIGLVTSAVVLIFWFGLYRAAAKALVNKTTTPLVDSARYLDASPYSHAARRAIRGGLVDLLHALHDGRYSRVVVVAHGAGTYIAYDALTAFWAETYELHVKENIWRITDFITIGAPMALADLLMTRPGLVSGFKKSDSALRSELFDGLVRRGAVVRCPPQPETILGPYSLFALTRWTNVWFPVIRGELHGDWFGGALGPLFGPGIRDIAVEGNKPERAKRGSAHLEYFRHPDKGGEGDLAWHLRETLAL